MVSQLKTSITKSPREVARLGIRGTDVSLTDQLTNTIYLWF